MDGVIGSLLGRQKRRGFLMGASLLVALLLLVVATSKTYAYDSDLMIIVKYKQQQKSTALVSAANQVLGAKTRKVLVPSRRIHMVELAIGADVGLTLQRLNADPSIEYAEINHPISASRLPNDSSFLYQWGLKNIGQDSGIAGIDIGVESVWDLRTDAAGVVIGVIDSGVDYNHPDLRPNIWVNEVEKNGLAGVDDDGNGYVDDIHGIDVINSDSDPMDDNGHGTHVAGVIAAVGNNGIGVAGVAWSASMVICKALDQRGNGSIAGAIECLEYFTKLKQAGINIVVTNNSYGGQSSSAQAEAIRDQEYQDILFVAAAGNDGDEVLPGADSLVRQYYPAAFPNSNILSVASLDRTGILAETSNYGAVTVDLAAPGHDVYSTLPNNEYGFLSGTSMAAPHVTGAVALLRAEDIYAPSDEVKSTILTSVMPRDSLSGKVLQGGVLQVSIGDDRDGLPDQGELLSKVPFDGIDGGIAVGSSGELLVLARRPGTSESSLIALDSNGLEIWSVSAGFDEFGNRLRFSHSPLVTTEGYIYVRSGYYLHKFSSDGQQLWRERLSTTTCQGADRDFFGSVTADGGVAVSCGNVGLIAFDSNGQLKWTGFWDPVRKEALSPSSNAAVDGNGNIYFSSGSKVVSLDRNGKLLFRVELGIGYLSTPVLSGNRIYVSSAALESSSSPVDNNVFALGLAGNRLWSTKLGSQPFGHPVIDGEGNLIVTSRNSIVTKVGPSGSVLWSEQYGDADATSTNGFVTVLESGEILTYVSQVQDGLGRDFLALISGTDGSLLWQTRADYPRSAPIPMPGQNKIATVVPYVYGNALAFVVGENKGSANSSWSASGGSQSRSFNVMRDRDRDGMDDDWELGFGFDSVSALDAQLDNDSDGITNKAEYGYGTNPLSADSDEDGLSDQEELIVYKTAPTMVDTDGDGLSDYEEVIDHSTNPLVVDTDEDGLLDGEEVTTYGTNPLSVDTDGDGYSDYQELNVLYTDPLNPDPLMADLGIDMSGRRNGSVLGFKANITNNGPADARDVVVNIEIPPSIGAFVELSGANDCEIVQEQKVVCRFSQLALYQRISLTIGAALNAASDDYKTATLGRVSGATYDYRPQNNEANLKSGCFIATAAFGHMDNKYVQILRNFRDRFLLTNELGKKFVETYYHYSPPAADWISDREAAKAIVRVLLLPIIAFAWLAQSSALMQFGFVSTFLTVFCLWKRRKRYYSEFGFV